MRLSFSPTVTATTEMMLDPKKKENVQFSSVQTAARSHKHKATAPVYRVASSEQTFGTVKQTSSVESSQTNPMMCAQNYGDHESIHTLQHRNAGADRRQMGGVLSESASDGASRLIYEGAKTPLRCSR